MQLLSQETVEEEEKAGLFATVSLFLFPQSGPIDHRCRGAGAGEGHGWCLSWCDVTPCLSSGGGEASLGDVVTVLQGLKIPG